LVQLLCIYKRVLNERYASFLQKQKYVSWQSSIQEVFQGAFLPEVGGINNSSPEFLNYPVQRTNHSLFSEHMYLSIYNLDSRLTVSMGDQDHISTTCLISMTMARILS